MQQTLNASVSCFVTFFSLHTLFQKVLKLNNLRNNINLKTNERELTRPLSREQLQRAALSLRRWTATFTCALAERDRFHFRVHFAGNVDKDCHEREGHEAYEVHSPSQGGLVGAGGARVAMSHEVVLGGQAHQAHTTTPHLVTHAPLSPHAYRALPEHEPQYVPQPAEPRASVIESSQPLIIECTWGLLAQHALAGRVFPRRIMWFQSCDLTKVFRKNIRTTSSSLAVAMRLRYKL